MALDEMLSDDERVMLFGLGVTDVGGVFGTTRGLQEKFGASRVFDIPLSENAVTGMALGLSLRGFRPILVHQRADFSFTAAEQVINQIAKTQFLSSTGRDLPLVIRMIVGRGWGQGPTHAQSPHAIFCHVPGLTVMAPATPSDGYHLLKNALNSNNPVIFMEHRWLHQTTEDFSPSQSLTSFVGARTLKKGNDLTLISLSYGVLELMKIAEVLAEVDIYCDVINLRTIKPLDTDVILESVMRTRKAVVWDIGHRAFGISSEISHLLSSSLFGRLDAPILTLGLPDEPTPSSPFLAMNHYMDIDSALTKIDHHFALESDTETLISRRKALFPYKSIYRDQPDIGEVGPF